MEFTIFDCIDYCTHITQPSIGSIQSSINGGNISSGVFGLYGIGDT